MSTRSFRRSNISSLLRWLLGLLCLCALGLAARDARAERAGASVSAANASATGVAAEAPAAAAAPKRRGWPGALDLGIGTRIPLSAGPELSLELPGRLLLQGHLGWMPEAYSRAVTGALRGSGLYDETVEALIDNALGKVSTTSISAGWRPFEGAGLELFAGYTRISLSGSTTSSDVIPVVARDVARQLREELGLDAELRLKSSVHAVRVGLGWRWLIGSHVVLRASAEYMKAFASSSRLDISSSPDVTSLAAPVTQQLLNDYYLTYVSLPLVGLSLSFRLS